MRNRACGSCKWWDESKEKAQITGEGDVSVGKCRINPPSSVSIFPVTQVDDWCAEHYKVAGTPGEMDRTEVIRESYCEQLLGYINRTPALLSLLYDTDLMPEQLKKGSQDWARMFRVAAAWKSLSDRHPKTVTKAGE